MKAAPRSLPLPERAGPDVRIEDPAPLRVDRFSMDTFVYPYSAAVVVRAWGKVTGMDSSLIREVNARRGGRSARPIRLISVEPSEVPAAHIEDAGITLEPIAPEPDPVQVRALVDLWFDDMWALLHPDAFTRPVLSSKLAERMLGPDHLDGGGQPHGFEYLVARIDACWQCRSDAAPGYLRRFSDRFAGRLAGTPPGSTLLWGDIPLFAPMLGCAPALRRAGVRQSMTCHLSIPPTLHRSALGRKMLEAMSLMDELYVHTDTYAHRLEVQLQAMGLPVPALRRFDLGIDMEGLRRALRCAPPSSSTLLDLDGKQAALVEDMMTTRNGLPHRFLCMDRLDPIKGLHIVLQAIDAFLTRQRASLEELRDRFRFYFLTDYLSRFPATRPGVMWHAYGHYLRTVLIPELERRWPGIVMFADNIPNRDLIAHLLRDCHGLAGGVQEGLNLSVQEGLFVNAECGHGRTAIIGSGAGLAIRARELGLEAAAHFPAAGDVNAMCAALQGVVRSNPEDVLARTRSLVQGWILQRTARLFEMS